MPTTAQAILDQLTRIADALEVIAHRTTTDNEASQESELMYVYLGRLGEQLPPDSLAKSRLRCLRRYFDRDYHWSGATLTVDEFREQYPSPDTLLKAVQRKELVVEYFGRKSWEDLIPYLQEDGFWNA